MESPIGSWDLVVKVKFGDTLRRLNVSVHRQDIDHDMNKLRAKIGNLFKFNANANMILTYTDEDGDIVTLVNDDELRDAVFRQHLNPLRISVQLNTDFAERTETRPCFGTSDTPSKSGNQVTLAPQRGSAIDDALQSVPDPLRTVLSKISHDFMSKAAASAPALTEFVEYFSKLGQSQDSTTSNSPNTAELGETSSITTNPVDHNASDRPKPLHDPAPQHAFSESSSLINQIRENSTQLPGSTNPTEGIILSAPDSLVDFNLEIPDLQLLKESVSSAWLAKDNAETENVANDQAKGKSTTATSVPVVDQSVKDEPRIKFTTMPTSIGDYPPPPGIPDVLYSDVKNIPCSTSPSIAWCGFNPQNNFPVNKTSAPSPTHIPPSGLSQVLSPYRRSYSHYGGLLRTFHRGVRCDGCGMHPIIGPRFKSNVKEDFDLCSICFSEMGNEADYTRIDRAPHRSPRFLKEFNHPVQHSRFHGPHGCRGYGLRPFKGKLESRFIQDVTVLDGTLVAPSTPFTKIWRMRNNGTIAWPSETQLVWIGGDQFADRGSVDLEISQNGFPVDEEIDVAVDFRAPSRPGRYISYWRMASPSGQKFGQRVWVLIQVDNSRPNSASGIIHPQLNLNLPPEASEQNGVGIIDVNSEPVESGVQSDADIMDPNLDLVKSLVNEIPIQSNVSNLLDSCGGLSQPLSERASSSSYPMIDLSSQPSPPCSEALESHLASTGQTSGGDNTVEQTLLKELEEMGFKQIGLNKEVLRLNDYDLEQSLNDLCGISEWDPILEELQEMGFCDKEKNKKLLIKNGGSIKRVVLDLIAGEKVE